MRTRNSETKAIQQISERLKSCYTTTEPATVDAAVRTARDNRLESRIRDYVPIFIERQARTTLDASGEHRQSPRDQ
ncbi:hypothetical protein OG607_20730 [Streptomyces sp. NBC_01537]|uniref:three-helix bundle dimerization domain-containing protein n=1 Tax=Streptomyces sp. NBC_01537 TaxID=2903896 RepID=UPI00386BDD73